MAGAIRLFEKTAAGLLVEVDPAQADARRAAGTVSHMNVSIDVLWTAAEIAEREAQEARHAQTQQAANAEREAHVQRRAAILGRLGLTDEEAEVLLRNA